MRILFYFAWSLDILRGAEISLLNLAEVLVAHGHHAGIVQLLPEGRPAQPESHSYAFSGPVWGIPVAYPGRRPRALLAVLRTLQRFQRILGQFKPDIVSVHCPSWQSVPVVCSCALPHEWRIVVTAHGSDILITPFAEPRVRPWLSRLFTRADAVSAVSSSLLQDVVRQFPVVQHKGRVIHNGLEPSWFEGVDGPRGAREAPYVLFVGRFQRVKGVDILLRAWGHVQAQTPEVALWLAADGEEIADLSALARTLGVNERVRFLGSMERRDLPALYRDAELVVMPSRSEGLPLVALEAGACGAVCVATRVGGLPEVIDDGVTGFLVEPESPEALADALLSALRLSPDDRRRIGAAARSKVAQSFTQGRMTAAYEALFRSVLDARRESARVWRHSAR